MGAILFCPDLFLPRLLPKSSNIFLSVVPTVEDSTVGRLNGVRGIFSGFSTFREPRANISEDFETVAYRSPRKRL